MWKYLLGISIYIGGYFRNIKGKSLNPEIKKQCIDYHSLNKSISCVINLVIFCRSAKIFRHWNQCNCGGGKRCHPHLYGGKLAQLQGKKSIIHLLFTITYCRLKFILIRTKYALFSSFPRYTDTLELCIWHFFCIATLGKYFTRLGTILSINLITYK